VQPPPTLIYAGNEDPSRVLGMKTHLEF